MDYKYFKKQLLKDPEFKKEYDKFNLGLWFKGLMIKFKIAFSK